MERRRRIVLASEKLNNMPQEEADALMRKLGAEGLGPTMTQKGIPAELRPVPEELKGRLSTITSIEFSSLLRGLGINDSGNLNVRLWSKLQGAKGAHLSSSGTEFPHEIIKSAEEAFYQAVDTEKLLDDLEAADTYAKRRAIVERIYKQTQTAKEFLDVKELVEAIQDGTLAEVPGIGDKFLDAATLLANKLVELTAERPPETS